MLVMYEVEFNTSKSSKFGEQFFIQQVVANRNDSFDKVEGVARAAINDKICGIATCNSKDCVPLFKSINRRTDNVVLTSAAHGSLNFSRGVYRG